MKKAIFTTFCALAFCLIPAFSAGETQSVRADELTLDTISVKENYYVEIQQEAIALPQLLLNENWGFTVDLFAETDDSYQSALAESAEKYQFEQLGKYRLRYTVFALNDETQSKTFYSTLNVVDTTAPQLELQYLYKDTVYLNSEVTISDAYVFDNSGEEGIPFEVKVYLNGADVTAKISGGKLVAEALGTLEVHYLMVDASGNEADVVYQMSVVEQQVQTPEEDEKDSGCASSIGLGVSGLAVLGGAALLMRKSKKED